MAVISFEEYFINKLSYERNHNFKNNGSIELSTELSGTINIISDTSAEVTLTANIGDVSNISSPFEVSCSIVGLFNFNELESNNQLFETFLKQNAVAILFPYLRSLVSEISLKSNEYPSLIMPVINVVKLLEDTDSIVVKRNYSE